MKRESGRNNIPNSRLRQQREANSWSQEYVARAIGTNNFTVGRWERGVSQPNPHFRAALKKLFQLSDEELGLQTTGKAKMKAPLTSSREQNSIAYPPPVYDPAIPSLLIQTQGLVGRDTVLERLKTHLLSHQQLALSALRGLPGVGKTALARQIANDSDVLAHFQHGILWAAMGQQPDIMTLLSNWGALLTVEVAEDRMPTDKAGWASMLRDVIGERFLLIILDDVWKIEDALALKVGGPHCAYLLTTRFPQIAVQFAGEQAEVISELDENEGVELLARFAPRVVTQEPEASRTLVHSTGGLPLALTIMGSYLQLQSHSEQPRRIKEALQRLQDVKERLRLTRNSLSPLSSQDASTSSSSSLHAVIALSVQQLSMEAQQALHALALLTPKPNTFSEKVALAVADCDVKTIDILSDAGLLETTASGRYTLHKTITDYARLDPPDVAAEQRLVKYCEDFVQARQHDYMTVEQSLTNVLMALQLAEKHSMHESFISMVLGLAPFWEARGLYDLARVYLERGLGYISDSSS
jgi:transcriptional regulator with XRE-family HTH domain